MSDFNKYISTDGERKEHIDSTNPLSSMFISQECI